MSQTHNTPNQAPTPPSSTSELEYRNLTSYFEKLVKYTYVAILLILATAGLLLWKSTSDVKSDASLAIERTKDSASREISKIGTESAEIARAEARKQIDEALEKKNIQQMIESTARERVGAAVDREIQNTMAKRIQELQNQVGEIGDVSSEGARLRLGFRPALDNLIKKTGSPNEAIRKYARSTLLLIGTDYEARLKKMLLTTGQKPSDVIGTILTIPPPKTLKELLEVIRHSEDVYAVSAAFLGMSEMTNTQIQVFDIPSAERWCAEHRPKCE